ncbi:PREDICTED: uncharacterized protein LOC106747558 isoform X2 [Dinoponera quadriceps]|uniref:Uncharacterized protein LOC106747558 isoform X2 n=1 Tax=Dinoponera quadriceps TaxID=609295 RepID=A0A6P3XQ81_DINQU|nr:PREDICTED: uncharacterized protein LOC106747558 isoform X2 [Dinoponera quadriceps]
MRRTKYVIFATSWWVLAVVGNVIRNEDICGSHNGRRMYLELGEKGVLYAKNVTFVRNAPSRQPAPRLYATTNSSHHQCSLGLVTCPSCVIVVTFRSIALSHHCGDGGVVMDSPCRCDYVWLSEPPYEDVSGTPFCGFYAPITYRSSTRTLSINLLYSQSHKHAFTIEYTAERNRLHLKGTEMTSGPPTKGSNGTGGGILTSPFFPARYPRDLGLEYIITCPSEALTCRIRLLFSDFQLASVSIMEFYDWNSQRLDVSSGARFRPPVIVSSGPSLLIRFYANGGTGLGYKAFYSFVIGHTFDKSVQPITDCGGYVENLGGAITMMNMVGQGVKTYDCVWLIRPPKNFLHMKTHMYLKVVGFADMAGNTELIIKEGPTSALMSLEVIRHPASQLQPPRHREHVAPVSSGFHVSLRGTFGPNSHLAIAYAAFSYMDCFAGNDFLCQNHRCIPSQLNCDGFDHCGDNSDEPSTCFQDWEVEPRDRKWHTNKANYYFPKIDRYPDLKTATLVFVASSLGLIVLISALIILLYRIGARARQQRELQSRLETISELLVFNIADGTRIDEISIPDDPPVYEAPPGYEEVAKLVLPNKARCLNRESCNRSSPNQHEDANSSTYLVVDGASNSRSSQTTPIPSGNNQRPRVPKSPPPPYITPPGTISRNVIAGLSASMKQICPIRRTWLRRSAQYPQSVDASSVHVAATMNRPATLDANWRPDGPPKETQVAAEDAAETTEENHRSASGEHYDETGRPKLQLLLRRRMRLRHQQRSSGPPDRRFPEQFDYTDKPRRRPRDTGAGKRSYDCVYFCEKDQRLPGDGGFLDIEARHHTPPRQHADQTVAAGRQLDLDGGVVADLRHPLPRSFFEEAVRVFPRQLLHQDLHIERVQQLREAAGRVRDHVGGGEPQQDSEHVERHAEEHPRPARQQETLLQLRPGQPLRGHPRLGLVLGAQEPQRIPWTPAIGRCDVVRHSRARDCAQSDRLVATDHEGVAGEDASPHMAFQRGCLVELI